MPHIVTLKTVKSGKAEKTEKAFSKQVNFIENSPFFWWLSEGQTKLPPEVERDNVEYKVKCEY